MELILALVIGGLYTLGLYLLMQRSIVQLILGIALLGHAANLLVFTAAGLRRGSLPLVPEDGASLVEPHADPVPQALVLTAIVIGFGVQSFALVLLKRAYRVVGTDDMDQMRSTDPQA